MDPSRPLKHENIVATLEKLVNEANALAEGKSTVEIDEDPRLCALMIQLEPIIDEIDQIVCTAFPNHPKKVALWKERMGIRDDEEDEDD